MYIGLAVTAHLLFQLVHCALSLLDSNVRCDHITLMLGSLLGSEIHGARLHVSLALLGKFYLLTDSIKSCLVSSTSTNVLNLVGKVHQLIVELSLLVG